MVIFHSYVSLPEGTNFHKHNSFHPIFTSETLVEYWIYSFLGPMTGVISYA